MDWKDKLAEARQDFKPKEHKRLTHKEIIAKKVLNEKRVSPNVIRRRWREITQ